MLKTVDGTDILQMEVDEEACEHIMTGDLQTRFNMRAPASAGRK